MKFKSQWKKWLFMSILIVFAISASGCRIPADETGKTIYIWHEAIAGEGTFRTSFMDVMSNESWFQAIIVYPLTWLINTLSVPLTVGGSVAVVTFALNTVLSLATLKSTLAQQKMQMVQPELDRINRKYEGKTDQQSRMRMSNELNAVYKKYDINPFGTLLTTFIQFPIVIAMYQAVQRSYAVQKGEFLGMILQNPPTVGFTKVFSGDMSGMPYVILFIIMAILQVCSMFLPMYLQKKKAREEAEKHHRKPQEINNTMQTMQYSMIAMILIFGLTFPTAMSLYWAIYSLFNIIKTLVTQRILDNQKMEAR